jgi:cbb3-type cytochrome oxidase subunit 3
VGQIAHFWWALVWFFMLVGWLWWAFQRRCPVCRHRMAEHQGASGYCVGR